MKLAFCFMSYGDVEQRAIWASFFKEADPDQYISLLHRKDGSTTTWLPNCTVIPTMKTEYAKFSLLEVQQTLFETACKDLQVTKCMLLSGDSIPLYPFSQIYRKLTADDKGYLQRFSSSNNRYEPSANKDAWPADKPWNWQVAHQWITLNRSHIRHLRDNWTMLKNVFGDSSVPDEYMYSVFFYGFGYLDTFHISSHMVTNWSSDSIYCGVHRHRKRPKAHHTQDFTEGYINYIYAASGVFLRKICSTATIGINWSANKPIIPVIIPVRRQMAHHAPKGRAFLYRNH